MRISPALLNDLSCLPLETVISGPSEDSRSDPETPNGVDISHLTMRSTPALGEWFVLLSEDVIREV